MTKSNEDLTMSNSTVWTIAGDNIVRIFFFQAKMLRRDKKVDESA
jgi:hypothetical protein